MATEPTVMKMRLAEIRKILQNIPSKPQTDYWLDEREILTNRAESALANKIRTIFDGLPSGYTRGEPSLKTQAKTRFLQWRENQAKGEWKKLSDEEKAVWEGYVTEGLEFGTIREKELGREAPIKVGDRVEFVRDVYFLGKQYRPGLIGEVRGINLYDGTDVVTSYSLIFNGAGLPPVNGYPHEIKKASHVSDA